MKKTLFALLFLILPVFSFAETVFLDTGRAIDGHIIEVTDEYIRMIVDEEIMKLRFRHMDIESAEKYRNYTPEPYTPPPVKEVVREKTYYDFLREGLAFASRGKFEEAILLMNKAVDLRDDVPDLYSYRGGIYQELGKVNEAIENFSKAIELEEEDIDLYARRGWLYQSLGKWQEAIEDYSKVLKSDPGNFEVRLERYNLYKEQKSWWKAREDLEVIIAMDPEAGEPYLDQAFLNFYTGSYYGAWQSIYEAGERKVKIPSEFIQVLKEKLKDPFLSEKKIAPKSIKEKFSDFLAAHVIAINAALLIALIGVIILLLPSKKTTSRRNKDIEDDDSEKIFRPVTDVKKAGFFKRCLAGLIDLILLSAIAWGFQILTSVDIFAILFGVLWLLKDSVGGVSIGKGLVGLRVVDEYGYRSIFFQGFLRNFTLAMPVIIFYFLFWGSGFNIDLTGKILLMVLVAVFLIEGLVLMVSRKSRQRLGDRMAGSYVHDFHFSWPSWPAALLSVILFSGYLLGMIAMNMTYNKAFLFRLNPLRYYHIEREFSFQLPSGWKILSEGEGGLVLENTGLEGSMGLSFNTEGRAYPLALCVQAFNQSMQDSGLVLQINEATEVSGFPAQKVGFVENESQTVLMVVYFKKQEDGDLYMFQATSPLKSMKQVMQDATSLMSNFRFE